jgi:hypothetical protein
MSDPTLDAIRAARKAISEEFGNDPSRLLKHYQDLQSRFHGKIIQGPEGPAAQQANAADREPAAL